jgi:hypothetical protein
LKNSLKINPNFNNCSAKKKKKKKKEGVGQ